MQLLVSTGVALAAIVCSDGALAQLGEVQKAQNRDGRAVAISGDWAAASPWVYQNHAGVWSYRQWVSGFRWANAIDGDVVAVGNNLDDPNGVTDAGSVSIHRYDPQTDQWVFEQKLFASDGAVNDQFGMRIAIQGTTILVTAAGRGDPSDGGVYVFERIDGIWQEMQFILPADVVGLRPEFGQGLDIDGERIAVGAPGFQRVFVFEKDESGVWQETFRHTGLMRDGTAEFGHSVALDGDRLVVGAPAEDLTNFLIDSGDFRIYDFDGTDWVMTRGGPYEEPLEEYDRVGYSVALADSGNVIILGAPEGSKPILGDGHIRAFRFDGAEWREIDTARPTDQHLQVDQQFGFRVAADGDWLMVGAPGDDSNELGGDGLDPGAAYFYDLTGQLGTRTWLVDTAIAFGTLVGGGSLIESDDSRIRIRSQFGFSAIEPNVAELKIGARNNVADPDVLNLLIEARITQPGGTMKVRLRNWNTNSFNQVHQYTIGPSETVEPVSDIPAANYIRANDNRIEVSLRSVVFATFAALGFEAQHDFINILVRE